MINEFNTVDYLQEARDPHKGRKSKTTEMFKEELSILGSPVIVLGDYVSAKEKVLCECPECNYRWDTTPNKLLSQRSGCPKCGGRVLPTLSEINVNLAKQGKKFKVFGSDPLSSVEKLKVVCSECSFTWSAQYNTLYRSGYSCKECFKLSKETLKDQPAMNYSFQARLDSLGKSITVLSDYTKMKSPIDAECGLCNYKWTTTPGNLLANGCIVCSRKLKGSLTKLQDSLNARQAGIEVSGEYVNSKTKVSCKCDKCGEEWASTPSNLYNHGCPFCCFKGRIPYNRPASLYYVRLESEGMFYWKIGITTKNNILERFRKGNRGVRVTLIYSYLFENGLDAYMSEKSILCNYKTYLIDSNKKILEDGNTEIFRADVLQMNHLVPICGKGE